MKLKGYKIVLSADASSTTSSAILHTGALATLAAYASDATADVHATTNLSRLPADVTKLRSGRTVKTEGTLAVTLAWATLTPTTVSLPNKKGGGVHITW